MATRYILLSGLLLAMSLLSSGSAWGQIPYRRYSPPAGPTTTPYLNYYRADWSTMPDSYRSFVLPQQRLRSDLYDIAQQQQADFREAEQSIKQLKNSTAAPTGSNAGYMNYSHYYQMQPRTGAARGIR